MSEFFRLTIPWIGAKITLAQPWTFKLHHEYRNNSMWTACSGPASSHASWEPQRAKEVIDVTLPIGTVLAVDRIYIRKGAEDFNSLTFRLAASSDSRFNIPKFGRGGRALKPKFIAHRFWAKLKDINNIICLPLSPDVTNLANLVATEVKFPQYVEEF